MISRMDSCIIMVYTKIPQRRNDMKELIKAIDNLPLLFKVILAIPALDIVWGIYRICCALDENDTTALIVAIVLLFIPIMWLIDIVMILMKGNVWRFKTAK